MRRLILPILLILISITAPTPAHATPQVKNDIGVCTKNKIDEIKIYKGQKYRCILISNTPYKKYHYILQATQSENTIQSSSSSFSSPLIIAGYNSIINKINSSPAPIDDKLTYVIDPNVSPQYITQLTREVNKVMKLYQSDFPNMNFPIRIYLYDSKNMQKLYELLVKDLTPQALEGGWLDPKLASTLSSPYNSFGGGAAGYGKDGSSVVFYYVNENPATQINQQHALIHEAIHIYQRNILGNMGTMPCWVREGQATYMGFTLAAKNVSELPSTWKAMYYQFPQNQSTKDFTSKTIDDWIAWLTEQETHSNQDCDAFTNYAYGAITYSYLYGTYGVDKVNELFRNINNYPKDNTTPAVNGYVGDSWLQAYNQTFGHSAQSEYLQIALYLYNEAKWYSKAPKSNNN